jgi:hypothetical protein
MFKQSKGLGMEDILKKNPDLARQMARAAAEQAVGPGFANFVSLGMGGGSGNGGGGGSRGPPPPQPIPSMPSMMMEEDMMPPMGGGIGGPIPSMDPRGGVDVGGAPMTARREMRGPSSGVDDILSQINASRSRAVPPPAFDADEIASVHSGVTTATERRAGMSRRRKTNTAQPIGATLTLNV